MTKRTKPVKSWAVKLSDGTISANSSWTIGTAQWARNWETDKLIRVEIREVKRGKK